MSGSGFGRQHGEGPVPDQARHPEEALAGEGETPLRLPLMARDVPPSGPSIIVRAQGVVVRPHSLDHSELEFSGPSQGDGLAASPRFINAIGGLLPMAPWGRTSL